MADVENLPSPSQENNLSYDYSVIFDVYPSQTCDVYFAG